MIALLLTVLAVLIALVCNEWWWRGRVHGETSRKFIHIGVGTFVAFWPLFLTWRQIEGLSLAFVIVVVASQKLQLFRAIHSVQRPTLGEVFFAMSVGLIAFMTHSPVIYAVALLHMSLADGLAATVGVRLGASQSYYVFGARKSLAGSMTFLAVSLAIFTIYCVNQDISFSPYLALVAVGATILENIAVRGFDNLVIPALIAWTLSSIS